MAAFQPLLGFSSLLIRRSIRPELMLSTSIRFLSADLGRQTPSDPLPAPASATTRAEVLKQAGVDQSLKEILSTVTDEQLQKAGLTAEDKRDLVELEDLAVESKLHPKDAGVALAFRAKVESIGAKVAAKNRSQFREPKHVPKLSAERMAELHKHFTENSKIRRDWFLNLTPEKRAELFPDNTLEILQRAFLDEVGSVYDIPDPAGVTVPSLNDLATIDDADRWICRVAQHGLFSAHNHLRADLETLKTRTGEVINVDTFLLPLPSDLRPDPALRTYLTTPAADPEEEQKRQIMLTGGHLDKRFKGLKTWEALKAKIAEGYRLEEAAILHYYSRIGTPAADPNQRRVTLQDIFRRRCDPIYAFDPIKWDLLDYQETRANPSLAVHLDTVPELPQVLTEHDHPSTKEFALSSHALRYAQWYQQEYERIQNHVEITTRAYIPSTEELAAMPAGLQKTLLQRQKDIHKGMYYSHIFTKIDEIFAYNKDKPSYVKNWLVKLAGAFASRVSLEERAVKNFDEFLEAGMAHQHTPKDPELHNQMVQSYRRLQTREEYDK